MIMTGPMPEYPEAFPGAKAFGKTLQMRRVNAGFTLRACAQEMRMSPTEFSRIEQGRREISEAEFDRFNEVIAKGPSA